MLISIKMINEEKYFTTSQIAHLLGVSRITVFNKIKSGSLKAIKIGRTWAIPRREVESLLGKALTNQQKSVIENAVEKTVHEYGQTLKMLGSE